MDGFKEIRSTIDIPDDQTRELAAVLINVVKRAARLGAAEILAQLIEHGIDIELHMDVGGDITAEDLLP